MPWHKCNTTHYNILWVITKSKYLLRQIFHYFLTLKINVIEVSYFLKNYEILKFRAINSAIPTPHVRHTDVEVTKIGCPEVLFCPQRISRKSIQ